MGVGEKGFISETEAERERAEEEEEERGREPAFAYG